MVDLEMDTWRVAVLGTNGVGKTALTIQVCNSHRLLTFSSHDFINPWSLVFIVYYELFRWRVNILLSQYILNHRLLILNRCVSLASQIQLIRNLPLPHKVL